jgi:cytochrome c2
MMRAVIAGTALALLVASGGAVGQELGSAVEGRELAVRSCAECHGIEKDQADSPVDGLASFDTIANSPGMSPLALEVWLTTPHREMPHLILNADERNDLIAYITSLKR